MPFGLQFKSIIVGFLLAYFVVPALLGLISHPHTKTAPTV